MSDVAQRELGERLEELAADRLDAEAIGERQGTEWFDLELADGSPAEVKGAVVEKSHGADRTVPGEWWIHRGNHEQLVDAGGYYVLVVYELIGYEPEVVDLAVLPAAWLEAFVSSWVATGTVTSSSCDEAAKVPHTRLFDGGESS